MDPIVEAALRKWPSVPNNFGWLGLDARGDWYLRDERAQAAGAFPTVKGSRIEHAGLRGFIQRNYASDANGSWFFQNGPQRVYVELEAAPWIWRLPDGFAQAPANAPICSHTGRDASFRSAWLDEHGRLFADTDIGFGLVHSLDMLIAAPAVEAGRWQPQEMPFADMPQRFGYVLHPASGQE
jgi:hypothetical protein